MLTANGSPPSANRSLIAFTAWSRSATLPDSAGRSAVAWPPPPPAAHIVAPPPAVATSDTVVGRRPVPTLPPPPSYRHLPQQLVVAGHHRFRALVANQGAD